MLFITIPVQPDRELFDETTGEFITIPGLKKEQKLQLEHSLVSISKWESKWHKPYLSQTEKSEDEIIDYVRCMTITQNVDPEVYRYLTSENVRQITEYIENPMTATWFLEDKDETKKTKKVYTAERIYYFMIALNIPVEFQKWHLNRLLTLIRVCNIENQPPKKRGLNETLRGNAAINKARKKQLNTKG